jgi:hypothetical protein
MMGRRFSEEALAALRGVVGETAGAAPGAVRSVVLRVDGGEEEALVTFERVAGGVRAACSCGRRPCGHLAAAEEVFAAPASPRPTMSPPSSLPAPPVRILSGERPSDAELSAALSALLDGWVRDGLAVGSARTDEALEDLVERVKGTDLYGLHRLLADVRREFATAQPSPARLVAGVDALSAARRVLDRRAAGDAGTVHAYDLLIGREPAPEEMETREALTLIDVARNTARTPFGYRRVERFLVDVETGATFVERTMVPLGDETSVAGVALPSVGPFPRLVRADLAAVASGPAPRLLRLLQYRVEIDAPASVIRRLIATAATDIETMREAWLALCGQVGTAWPLFVLFAPSRALARDGEVVLIDAAGRLLPLARSAAPDTCAAVDRLLARGRIEMVIGHLVSSRRMPALSPLGVLIDSPRGERIVPLR